MLVAACSAPRDASRTAATPEARKAIGLAAAYRPEAISEVAEGRIKTSMRERRAFAWRAVAKALAPGARGLPAWASWYAKDDFQRVFHKLYDDAGKERRALRDPFSDEETANAVAWNVRYVDELPAWPEGRYDAWLASLDTDAKLRGVAGLARTFYAPAAMQAFLGGYSQIDRCQPGLPALDFLWKNPDPANFTYCFPREFDRAAAIAKTAWKRRDFGLKVPVYDTDATSLSRRLADANTGWGAPDREVSPNDDAIYAIEAPGGARFQLAALHLMTKELREWAWITLWWSDDPDSDFGEDRPAEIRALGGPWSHYKMCVVTGFEDQDVPDVDYAATYPSLASALAATKAATAPYTWCSNAHVELGASNQRSNCIGCHQHGGSMLNPQDILANSERFPGGGSGRVRENFPADYLWSFGREPERLSGYIRQQIDHYDVYDRF